MPGSVIGRGAPHRRWERAARWWLAGLFLACASPEQRLPTPRPPRAPPPSCVLPGETLNEFRFGILAGILSAPAEGSNLESWLTARVGIPVRVETVDRYEDLGLRLLSGSLEAALLPPLEYVRTHDRDPCIRARLTAVVGGAVRYSSFLIARKEAHLESLGQVRGLRGVFVSPESASGWLFALRRLQEAGLDPWRDLSEVQFLGSHPAVIEAVLEGKAELGATFDGALRVAQQEGWNVGALSLVAMGGRIPYDAVVLRPGLPENKAQAFLQALRSLDSTTPEGHDLLSGFPNYNGFVPTDDSFYDDVRRVAQAVLIPHGRVP